MWHHKFKSLLHFKLSGCTLALTAQGIALRQGQSLRVLTPAAEHSMTRQEVTAALRQVAPSIPAGKIRLIISNHFVRYTILPWQPGLFSRSDWLALAQHTFKKRYGQAAEQWQITVDLQTYGEAVLACGIDLALIDEVKQIASTHDWQLTRLEPLLSAVMQHAPCHAGDWLLVAEPERLLLCERATGWQAISVMAPPAGEMLSQATQMLNRAWQQTTQTDNPLEKMPKMPRLWLWTTYDLRHELSASALAEALPDWHTSHLPHPAVSALASRNAGLSELRLSALSMTTL